VVAGRAMNWHLISANKLFPIATLECLGKAFDTRPQHRAVNNPLE
jgi:hypothetical protein